MASTRDHGGGLSHLQRLANQAALLIKIGLWCAALLFGAITFQAISKETFDALVSSSSLIWKFAIVVYFTSWIVGVQIDKDRERDIFKTAPREGRLDTLSITLAMTVFVLFGLMYLIEDISTGASQSFAAQRIKSILTDPVYRDISILFKNNEHKWVIVLIDVLWVFNIPLWLYFIKHFIKPMAKKSLEDCSKNRNYAGIKRIEIMESYLVGKWQKWRFGAGLAYLLIVDLFYVGFLRNTDDGTTHLAIPICGFVLAAEGWVWLMRFKVKFALECVDEIVDRYRLVRKPASRDNLEQA